MWRRMKVAAGLTVAPALDIVHAHGDMVVTINSHAIWRMSIAAFRLRASAYAALVLATNLYRTTTPYYQCGCPLSSAFTVAASRIHRLHVTSASSLQIFNKTLKPILFGSTSHPDFFVTVCCFRPSCLRAQCIVHLQTN